MASTNASPFRFLDLPAEIRANVYQQYFSERTIMLSRDICDQPMDRCPKSSHDQERERTDGCAWLVHDTALVRTCRMVYEEASREETRRPGIRLLINMPSAGACELVQRIPQRYLRNVTEIEDLGLENLGLFPLALFPALKKIHGTQDVGKTFSADQHAQLKDIGDLPAVMSDETLIGLCKTAFELQNPGVPLIAASGLPLRVHGTFKFTARFGNALPSVRFAFEIDLETWKITSRANSSLEQFALRSLVDRTDWRYGHVLECEFHRGGAFASVGKVVELAGDEEMDFGTDMNIAEDESEFDLDTLRDLERTQIAVDAEREEPQDL